MGYERKELQIIGGTFNLLPPVDKVPSQDYLLAQNWRVDRDGKLVSRYGYPQKFSIPGAGVAHSAASFGGVEGDYYVAANNGNGPNPCSVYWNFGGSPIVSGLSGNRVGMVPMNGWMWIMDSAVQRKYSPTGGSQAYNIAAPTNAPIAFVGAAGTDPTGPSGTYQFYVTFETADESVESNPSPVSNSITLNGQDAILSSIPISTDSQVGIRNIYATGGTLGQPYLIGTINDNVTTAAAFNVTDSLNPEALGGALLAQWSDLSATDEGIVMPTTNDPPPAGAGLVGPYFSRLFTWVGNRLFWTDPDTPQYWPGSANPSTGNWADVGIDGENIIWCTMHTNVLVIYKERSIWWLVGDPDTGFLDMVTDTVGLASAFGVAGAGSGDYFVAPNGLYRFDVSPSVRDMTDPIRPLFDATGTNAGALTTPGCILPSSAWSTNALFCYAVALGYAMGKLYIAYAENGSASNVTMVYSEAKRRWAYHRTGVAIAGFQGWIFDGIEMVGLTGVGGNAVGLNVDDFRQFYPQDPVAVPIECVYQSHYEDCGTPDSQKVWLEVVIDYHLAGDTASVYVGLDNGRVPLTQVGTVTGTTRTSMGFAIAFNSSGGLVVANPDDETQKPALARNISVAFDCVANGQVIIHNVYLYYYQEARLARSASSLPTDLGIANVKQVKEIELDIDASGGAVGVNLYSDLPGNQLAVRVTPTVPANGGRALLKFPFNFIEGYIWKLALNALVSPFRVYGARLLARIVGVYVEAYEAANGFVWDSMEMTFDSGITHIPRGYAIALAALPIKRFREIRLELETFGGNVTLNFLTDIPGDAQASRFTATINTGSAGRRFFNIPLPSGTAAPIEGRLCRIQLSGTTKFILYNGAVEVLAVGVYIEAYEASAGAVYDSREQDFSTPAIKEAREIELDIETTGSVTSLLLSDLGVPYSTGTVTVSTSGRQKVMLPLTVNAAVSQFVEGRLLRLILSGSSAVRLYGARILIRAFGQYLLASETQGGALWDSTELDLGTQQVKQQREVELDIWAYGTYTVTVYTDLPGNAMAARVTETLGATAGRTKVQVPLPQGSVPDNYIFGRLARVTITSAASFKLFGARIHTRAIGVYVETYEAAGGAVWDATPSDLGSPSDKTFDQVRIEMDSDGSANVTVYTDLPGETFTSKGTYALTNTATSRHWATAPLPAGIEGRSVRLVVSSATGGFRIYKAQVRAFEVGRYLCAQTPSGSNDALTTLEFDFRSERVKLFKKIEIDMRADQTVIFAALTDQSGTVAQVYNSSLTTPNGRTTLSVVFPQGVRGRLLRLALTGGPARIYHARVWTRPVNEPGAKWEWQDYPLEESEVLPKWSELPVEPTAPNFAWADLPVAPTPPEWQWAQFPVAPTEAQWFWAKVLSIDETPEKWEWVEVPGLTQ